MRMLLAPLFLTALSACGYQGPEALKSSRPLYNIAIQQTNDQELLLNLVRIRYRDTIFFTSVEKIAATQEVNRSFGVGGALGRTSQAAANPPAASSLVGEITARTLSLGPNAVAINEKPTVFYAPLDGERFVRQMMTPLNPDMLFLLVRSGWSIDRVLSVGVQELNGLKNAPSASGPAPSRAPVFEEFREAVLLMRLLQRDHQLDLVRAEGGGGVELVFGEEAGQNEAARRLKHLLRLEAGRNRFPIVSAAEYRGGTKLAASTRSMLAALHYLSTGIEVPPADIAAGRVRQTVTATGEPFDWQSMLGGVFRVHAAADEPANAAIAIPYRDAWFYIADDDLDSKSTFVLLTQLTALHSVPPAQATAISFSLGQ